MGQTHASAHPVVARLDPLKYSGLWWEVARYDTLPFEKGCSRASAYYEWDPIYKQIRITNTCYQGTQPVPGRVDQGTAKILDPMQPGKLSVTFDRFPTYSAPYWVHYTDYVNFSIVGGPDNTFLWILSRRPIISQRDVKFLMAWITALGYDTKPLIHDPMVVSNTALPLVAATPEPLHINEGFMAPNVTY